ncbi:hypothetical protein [Bradyrhizobium sp. NC92]|uniref:hypothetical protein n=1 Tax=Bradyrhizobium sp. (strain NC92) TaxID=55395 RepID=UPI0021A9EBBF|nr:hypothetical protein [Bradyrhizobium sp. NC92]UWU66231.1 hypothetical protein N2602_23625 [Bradyrhizobium sp. NC92]
MKYPSRDSAPKNYLESKREPDLPQHSHGRVGVSTVGYVLIHLRCTNQRHNEYREALKHWASPTRDRQPGVMKY